MQFLAYSASADGQRHRLRGRTADFLAESSVRTGTLKKDRNVLNGRPSTIHLRAKGQRRVTSASLSPRFGTPDLLDEDELLRLQRLRPRLRSAPCSSASSSSSPELKVLLEGVGRGGDEPTPDERALARLSRSCGVCGTGPLAKGGHDGRDRLYLRAERHPNCQAAAREQRDTSRSNPGGRAFPE